MAQDRAIKDAFNKKSPKKFPQFKKKGQHDSFRYPQGIKVSDNRVFLPKIGWVGFFKSRDILGKIKNATVSKKGEYWFVSIQTELEAEKPAHGATSAIGVDLGVKKFATLSDGRVYEAKNSFKKRQARLAKLQQRLSKKKKSMLSYKLGHLGGELLLVDPHYTSQKCSSCGHTEKDNRLSQAQFACMGCGFRENAEVNAAKNVLAAGHAVLSLQPEAALAA